MRPRKHNDDEQLRAVTFNVYVGQSPTSARRNLVRLAKRTRSPHVIALQEAKRFEGTIPGYHRFAPGNGEVAWLIRNDVDVEDRSHLETGGGAWHGPQGGTQPARIFPTLRVRLGGQLIRLVDVHHATRTQGAADNRRAEQAALREWFKRGDAPAIALGDWNSGLDLMRRFARDVGGRVSLFAPDGAVVQGARIVKVRRLISKYGSDHHRPIVYTFRVPQRSPR